MGNKNICDFIVTILLDEKLVSNNLTFQTVKYIKENAFYGLQKNQIDNFP